MELESNTKLIISRTCKIGIRQLHDTRNIDIALHDIMNGAPSSVWVEQCNGCKLAHKADLLIGFYALKPIEFTIDVDIVLPYYFYLKYNLMEPAPFSCFTHKIAENQFVFAYSHFNNDYAINMIGMQYNNIILRNIKGDLSKLLCVYGFLDICQRKEVVMSKQNIFYICPSLENRLATKIQQQWRQSISNPLYRMCRTRLMREASEIYIK